MIHYSYGTERPILHEISLGGFRTFKQLTRLPLERITLLFGPNSAGKSSLTEGIKFLKWNWDLDSPRNSLRLPFEDSEDENVWRKETEDGPRSNLLVQCKVSGKLPERYFNDVYTESIPDFLSFREKIWNIEAQVELTPYPGRLQARRKVTTYLDGVLLFVIDDFSETQFNALHPLISKKKTRYFEMLKIAEVANAYPHDAQYVKVSPEGIVIISGGDPQFSMLISGEFWQFRVASSELLGPKNSLTEADRLYVEAANELGFFLHKSVLEPLVQMVGWMVCGASNHGLVPASRNVPSNSELTYTFPIDSYQGTVVDSIPKANGSEEFRELAESSLSIAIKRDFGLDRGSPKLFESVNYLLSHHLFADLGYQVDVDYRLLVNAARFKSGQLPPTNAYALLNYGELRSYAIATLKLIDPQSRRLDFSQVGSGIGYAMPVLVQLAHAQHCIIQQPELHLHPALQSAIADAFVDSKSRGSTSIIETHSEHLVLRLLRRVRETSSGKRSSADSLAIRPDEIKILYFQPENDGTTSVKEIGISTQGTFLDRWPGGFFEERAKDLFDE